MRGNGARGRTTTVAKRTHGSSGRPFQVSSILSASFTSLGINAKLKEHKIKKLWPDCVGGDISKRARPTRLIGTTLYCAVSSSPWMAELNYHKGWIMKKINESLGEAAVSAIVFKIAPMGKSSTSYAPTTKPPRALSEEEKAFIEESSGRIKDGTLKALVKRVMEKARS